jgi:integrase
MPAKAKVRRVKHHAALPYAELPDFIANLRAQEGVAARALEFTILSSVRTGDIIGSGRDDKPPMRWADVDLSERIWTIPATKTDREHRVPLSNAAVSLLKELKREQKKGVLSGERSIVFPGLKRGCPLSNMAMLKVIERMNDDRTEQGLARFVDPKQSNADITVHGFRSTFRDWAAERANFPSEVVEMALTRAVGDKVEAAYRRGDLFEKRRRLMAEWASYCNTPGASVREKVVSMRGRG